MTAMTGPILFNASFGSDTLASGCGPAVAVTGSGASTTASSAVVTGINTTGILPGHCLWVQSSSGRQFTVVATVDSGTQVTCDHTFAVTESGRNWACGGKRATIQGSTNLFGSTLNDGVIIELETDQTITSTNISMSILNDSTHTSLCTFRGNSATTHRVINYTGTATDTLFNLGFANSYLWENMKFTHSGASGNVTVMSVGGSTSHGIIRNCIFGDSVNDVYQGCSGSGRIGIIENCLFQYCSYRGLTQTSAGVIIRDCRFRNCGVGLYVNASGAINVARCIFHSNTTGISHLGSYVHVGPRHVSECIFHANTTAMSAGNYAEMLGLQLRYNLFTSNGTALTAPVNGSGNTMMYARGNYFWNNTTNRVNLAAGFEDNTTSITVDPYVDAANADFNLNRVAGGGLVLRGVQTIV